MKSIHDFSMSKLFPDKGNIFTKEVNEFIDKEQYRIITNSCYSVNIIDNTVYYIIPSNMRSEAFSYNIYIGSNGIAIDKDYRVGGNYGSYWFPFNEELENPFEEAYDMMVEELNNQRING